MTSNVLASLAMASMAVPAAAAAHETSTTPIVAQGNTLLNISADGRTSLKPDMAVFSAGVTTQGATAGEAMAANSTSMARAIAALKAAGIADRDIQTSHLNLNPVYGQQRQLPDGTIEPPQPKIIGYQANNTVTVKQRNLDQFGKVIDTLVKAGANQVNGPSFMMDNPDAALDEARTQAMTRARARADLYARAAGLKVVRILSISEGGGYSPPMPVMYARAAGGMEAPPPPIAAGQVDMNASVNVLFELAP